MRIGKREVQTIDQFDQKRNREMKARSLLTLVAATLFSASLHPASARPMPSISQDVTVSSLYLWRGMRIVDDPVLQPSVTAAYGGLSVGIWGNLDLGAANQRSGEFTELDYTVDYSFTAGKSAISFGSVTYDFPTYQASSTTELYGSLGLAVPANPSITIYQDIDEAEGTYVSLGVGHSLPIPAWNTGLDLSASLGLGSGNHNRCYHGSDQTALSDITLGVGLPLTLGQGFTLTPKVVYNGIIDRGIRNLYDDAGKQTDHFMAAVSLAKSF